MRSGELRLRLQDVGLARLAHRIARLGNRKELRDDAPVLLDQAHRFVDQREIEIGDRDVALHAVHQFAQIAIGGVCLALGHVAAQGALARVGKALRQADHLHRHVFLAEAERLHRQVEHAELEHRIVERRCGTDAVARRLHFAAGREHVWISLRGLFEQLAQLRVGALLGVRRR
ncbi:MAG: hypothetical protein K0R40_4341, partial [Burkholderiales bacterium]|nr:hypothetical protein [Burkholderiales bacterium]